MALRFACNARRRIFWAGYHTKAVAQALWPEYTVQEYNASTGVLAMPTTRDILVVGRFAPDLGFNPVTFNGKVLFVNGEWWSNFEHYIETGKSSFVPTGHSHVEQPWVAEIGPRETYDKDTSHIMRVYYIQVAALLIPPAMDILQKGDFPAGRASNFALYCRLFQNVTPTTPSASANLLR